MSTVSIEQSVKSAYDEQYNTMDTQWRELGAKEKAKNLISLCQELKPAKLLDVGSGEGAILAQLDAKKFVPELYSIEISSSGVEKIKGRKLSSLKEVVLYDGYKIPFADKSFPLTTCSHVIEHVEHPRILLREMARVSEYQYFEIPIDFSFFVDKKSAHFLEYGHINIYTPSLFKFLLKSEGFEVVKEEFLFYNSDIIKTVSKGSFSKLVIKKFKTGIIKTFPFLRKTKPDAYSVLCKHTKSISIF